MNERHEGKHLRRQEAKKRWKTILAVFLSVVLVMQSSNIQAFADVLASGGSEGRDEVVMDPAAEDTGTQGEVTTPEETNTADEQASSQDDAEQTVAETEENPVETTAQDTEATTPDGQSDQAQSEQAPAEETDTTVTLNVEVSAATLKYSAQDGTEKSVTSETDPKSVDVTNTHDFTFTVAPDDGQQVSSVAYAGTELTANDSGEYTIAAADLTDGEKIIVTTEAVPTEEPAEDATPVEPEETTEEGARTEGEDVAKVEEVADGAIDAIESVASTLIMFNSLPVRAASWDRYAVTVVLLGANGQPEASKAATIGGGVIADQIGNLNGESLNTEGYDYVNAKVGNGATTAENVIAFAGGRNSTTYYSADSESIVASALQQGESIFLYFEPHVDRYTVTYNVTGDDGQAGNTYSGPAEVRAGDALSFTIDCAYGYTVEASIGGKALEANESGVYAVENIQSNTQVDIAFSKNETIDFIVDFTTDKENWHDTSLTPNGIRGIQAGSDFSFTLETQRNNDGAQYWRFDSLELNGETISLPRSYDTGASETTTLSNGVGVTVRLTDIDDGFFVYQNPRYTYRVTVSNAYEDIHLTNINFCGNAHSEVIPHFDSDAVNVTWVNGSGGQGTAKNEGPVQTRGFGYVDFSFQVQPGYRLVDVKLDGVSQGAVTALRVNDRPATIQHLDIETEVVSYGVKYDSAEENAQVPTDGGTYAINGQTNIVVGSAPTNYKGDKIFLGWKLGEDVYMPGDVVALSKAAPGAENGTITFIAQWGGQPSSRREDSTND